jgi:hypothetical protein
MWILWICMFITSQTCPFHVHVCFYNTSIICSKVQCHWNVNESLIWCCNNIIIQWSIIIMCDNVIITLYQWLYQHNLCEHLILNTLLKWCKCTYTWSGQVCDQRVWCPLITLKNWSKSLSWMKWKKVLFKLFYNMFMQNMCLSQIHWNFSSPECHLSPLM